MFIDERTQNRLHAVPGESISHGTMRTQDLIPAFLDVIRDTPEYVQVMNAIPAHAMEDKEADWWNSDDAAGLLESLFDTLDSYHRRGTISVLISVTGPITDFGKWTSECRNMVRITKDKRHDILKDGICIGQIYLARAESRKLRYWAISCMSGIGFNTFNEARSYAKDFL